MSIPQFPKEKQSTEKYAKNQGKAHAYTFGKCVKELQTRIEEHKDFESQIRNDPIALLKHLSKATDLPVEEAHPLAAVTKVLLQLLQTQQRDKEDLLDYIKRFKQSWRMVKSHMGDKFSHNPTENTAEYKELSIPVTEAKTEAASTTAEQIDVKMKSIGGMAGILTDPEFGSEAMWQDNQQLHGSVCTE